MKLCLASRGESLTRADVDSGMSKSAGWIRSTLYKFRSADETSRPRVKLVAFGRTSDVDRITIALSKGRIFSETLPLLASAGIRPDEDPETSRRLILATRRADVNIIIVRASDVPTYVRYGAADLGIAGKDVLHEQGVEGVYQPLDLQVAKCRMMVAVPEGFDYALAVRQGARLRVASKYLRTAREHFAAKGVHVDLIKLYGSMELAPLVGLADAIVDLVSTGDTLRANNLVAVEEIMPISARLIVNQAALKLKDDLLQPLLDAFARVVEERATHVAA